MATHSSILAWKISSTEEPGRLQYMRLQRVRCDCAQAHTHGHTHTQTHTHTLLLLYSVIPDRYFYVICGMYIYILLVTSFSFVIISVSYFFSKL